MNKTDNYFKSYPNVDKLYETEDGQVFVEKAKAEAHAHHFKDGKVKEYNRQYNADSGQSANDKLLVTDFNDETLKQQDLLKLAKDLKIQTSDNKKETLIAALKAEQDKLKTVE